MEELFGKPFFINAKCWLVYVYFSGSMSLSDFLHTEVLTTQLKGRAGIPQNSQNSDIFVIQDTCKYYVQSTCRKYVNRSVYVITGDTR